MIFNTSLRQEPLWFYTSWYFESWQLYSVRNASKPHHITESCDFPFRDNVHFPDGDCTNFDGRSELPCITIQANTTRRKTSRTRLQHAWQDTMYPALSHVASARWLRNSVVCWAMLVLYAACSSVLFGWDPCVSLAAVFYTSVASLYAAWAAMAHDLVSGNCNAINYPSAQSIWPLPWFPTAKISE